MNSAAIENEPVKFNLQNHKQHAVYFTLSAPWFTLSVLINSMQLGGADQLSLNWRLSVSRSMMVRWNVDLMRGQKEPRSSNTLC